LRRDTIDALANFRGARALPTWDDAIIAVLDVARERTVVGEGTVVGKGAGEGG
jgi:hypothetical protein